MDLLNRTSDFQIIPAYTEHKPPTMPYATYYVNSLKNVDIFGAAEEEYVKKEHKYLEKALYRIEAKVQFDVYASNEKETILKAMELRENILFRLRFKWGRINVGIARHADITTMREEIQGKYEYRAMFHITFEYMRLTKEREVLIAREVDLIAEEEKEK